MQYLKLNASCDIGTDQQNSCVFKRSWPISRAGCISELFEDGGLNLQFSPSPQRLMINFSCEHVLVTLGVCVFLATAGCTSSPQRHFVPANEIINQLRQLDSKTVSVQQATAAMESHGFKCSQVKNGTFSEAYVDSSGITKHRKIEQLDFVHCHRESHRGVVSYRDEVALVIKEDQITDVLSNHSATGP